MEAIAKVVSEIAWPQVKVQAAGRRRQDDAPVAVHDRLGKAGGTARVQDPERMIERQPFGFERGHRRVIATDRVGEVDHVGGRRLAAISRDQKHGLDRGKTLAKLGYRGTAR